MRIIGLTSGCFDLIHFGHLHYLQRCRELCTQLIVGIDSDALVRATKGPSRPITPEEERLELIRSLGCVDSAFILHDVEDLHRVSVSFGVHKVFKHEGFKKVERVIGVDGTKAELVVVPDVAGMVSTTEIISRVRAGLARS